MTKCAIIFWGLTRGLEHTLPNIKKKLFTELEKNNIDYDIFIHSWYFEGEYINHYHNYKIKNLTFDEYKLLNYKVSIYENQDNEKKKINFNKYFNQKDPYNTNYKTIENYIMSLISQKKIIEEFDKVKDNYDFVIFQRPDQIYVDKFKIKYFNLVKNDNIVISRIKSNEKNIYNKKKKNFQKICNRWCLANPKNSIIYGNILDYLLEYSINYPIIAERFLYWLFQFKLKKKINFAFCDILYCRCDPLGNVLPREYDLLEKNMLKDTCLILYHFVTNIDHLIKRLEKYQKFFKNIVIITFKVCVKDNINDILKFVKKDNLILIESSFDYKKLKEKVTKYKKITPFKITNPKFSFWSSIKWFDDKYENGDDNQKQLKGIYRLKQVYEYFNKIEKSGKKYKYYFILRNDFDIRFDILMLNKLFSKILIQDKIVVSSMKSKKVDYDFQTIHNNQKDKNINTFYLANWFFFGSYKKIFDLLKKIQDKTDYKKYNIWNQSESYLFATYILKSENKFLVNDESERKELIEKYFHFYDLYDFKKHKCNNCIYMERQFVKYKRRFNKNKNPINPCINCAKNIFKY